MPVPTDSDPLLSLLADREERSLLSAAGITRTLEAGEATGQWVKPLVEHVFHAAIERRRLLHIESLEVPREHDHLGELAVLGDVELSWRLPDGHDALLSLGGGAVALLTCGDGACEILVAGREPDAVTRELRRLATALRAEPVPHQDVAIRFWSAARKRPRRRRSEDAPEWPAIERNYPRPVREQLGRLVATERPGAGTLLLWHGAPGTGKTHAIRALARAWRSWCTVHCITDPEELLVDPEYLLRVVTAEVEEDEPTDWRLVVLEDSGELMSATARTEIGQGLSRVLNLTDGLLGQDVRTLLLVTTNEPVGRMHPAVRRPGRCWATVDFASFAPDEATAWLALRGVDREVRAPATLAELYAIAEGRELPAATAKVGFGFARALSR
jgi:hypothetical protein